MRLAILGTRGVPGGYGGFETFAEELGARFVQRGHAVTVYCRNRPNTTRPRWHRGIRLVYLPAVRTKSCETLSHTVLSAIHAASHSYDVVYVCNSANAPICLIPWARRQRTVLNVDGLEWERAKWGRAAKTYYRLAARLAARLPIEIVTDALVIQHYYKERLNRETRLFPYGTDLYDRGYLSGRVHQFGLRPDRYVLYVSRMEPENNALLVVQAYRLVNTDIPLVMVGDAPYAQDYIARVREEADPRVRFLGYRFGDDYHALQANAAVYVQATEVGGTHPALVEALGHQNAVLAHDVPEHREVLGSAGHYFRLRDKDHLASQLAWLLGDQAEIARCRTAAAQRARQEYTWEAITDAYETFFQEGHPRDAP